MTCLVSWLSVDERGPSAIYVVTESRISWGDTRNKWDFGRKIYTLKNHPDIFGFAGDVVFASQVLSQLTEIADKGLLFGRDETSENKFSIFMEKIKDCFDPHPKYPGSPEFEIVHCSRDASSGSKPSLFKCFSLSWRESTGWSAQERKLPEKSDVIISSGSGKNVFERLRVKNRKHFGDLSRGIFVTFCDATSSGLDPKSGGAPQLVALYRKGNTREFGFLKNGRRYYFGMEVPLAVSESIEWRNDSFERCDPVTMTLIPGAQRQPRIKEFDMNLKKLRDELT